MKKCFSLIGFVLAVHVLTGNSWAVDPRKSVSILKGPDSAKAMLKAAAPAVEKLKDTAKALVKEAAPAMAKDTAKAPAAKAAAPAAPATPVAKDTAKVQPKPAPAVATAPPAPAGDCSVTKLVFARKVENRNPVEEGTEFQAADGQIVCWTRLACGSGPGVFKHVWYRDGVRQNEIVLNLKTGQGRVFTRKTVVAGKWKVEVTTETGTVIGSGEMTVK